MTLAVQTMQIIVALPKALVGCPRWLAIARQKPGVLYRIAAHGDKGLAHAGRLPLPSTQRRGSCTLAARSLRRTLENMATPCAVKA